MEANIQETSSSYTAAKIPNPSRQKLKEKMEDIPETSNPYTTVKIPAVPDPLLAPLRNFRPRIIDQSHNISRFPQHIRERRLADIRPRVVSIGPFFHGDPHLKGMEQQKQDSMWDLFSKCTSDLYPLPLVLSIIRELETRARECYSETIELSSDEFVQMLLLDSCFIIRFLISISHEMKESLVSLDWNIKEIRSDLLLLENQIPFSVVNAVYDCIIQHSRQIKNLPSFSHILEPFVCMDIPGGIEVPCDVAHHLLDLYWLCFLPNYENEISLRRRRKLSFQSFDDISSVASEETYFPHKSEHVLPSQSDLNQANGKQLGEEEIAESVSKELIVTPFLTKKELVDQSNRASNWAEISINVLSDASTDIPSATELHRVAGVIFKRLNAKLGFEVMFRNGIMKMPSLKVDQSRKIILTNLIGYEKFFHPQMRKVSSYMLLMDSLINTEEDVEFLQQSGVIVNRLSNNSIATTFFNETGDMCTVDYQRHLFANLFKDVNKYYNSQYTREITSLRQNYFNNPWAVISVFAGGLLLLLTFIQTFFGGIQTFYAIHPQKVIGS